MNIRVNVSQRSSPCLDPPTPSAVTECDQAPTAAGTTVEAGMAADADEIKFQLPPAAQNGTVSHDAARSLWMAEGG